MGLTTAIPKNNCGLSLNLDKRGIAAVLIFKRANGDNN
jgi:hypothetical protein